MARGTSFLTLITRVREEAGHWSSVSLGTEELNLVKTTINRVYTTFYNKYDWPFLRQVFAKKTLSAGQQYYDPPTGCNIDRIEQAKVFIGDNPYPVSRGISVEDYAIYDTSADERSDPVQKWDIKYSSDDSSEMIEVWPLPASTQYLQFIGIRSIDRMTADDDTCLLDDDLIVLYTVAEMAAREKLEDAQFKLQAAADHLKYLRSRYVQTYKPTQLGLGTGARDVRPYKAVIDVST